MALPQLRPLVPATLCGNRSHPVSRDVIRPALPVTIGPGPTDVTTSARLKDVNPMERLASQAAEALAGAPAEDVVRWAADTFGDRMCITSSMTDAVIVHLVSQVRRGVDVIFLDTGYHFAETIGTRGARAAAGGGRVPTPERGGGGAAASPTGVSTGEGGGRAPAAPARAAAGGVSEGPAAAAGRRRARRRRSPGGGRHNGPDGRGAG